MSDEDRARKAYDKALTLRDAGNYFDAIRILSNQRVNTFNAMYIRCFSLLVDLCLRDVNNSSAKTIIVAMKNARDKLIGTQHLEDGTQRIVDTVLERVRAMCVTAQGDAARMVSNPPEGAHVLAALTGVPMHVRARECYVAPCEHIAAGLAHDLFSSYTIGTSRKVLPIYNTTARQFAAMCREFVMYDALEKAAESVTRTLQRVFLDPIAALTLDEDQYDSREKQELEMRTDRKDFFDSPVAVRETVTTLCMYLTQLAELGRWRHAWYVLYCLKRLTDQAVDTSQAKETLLMAYKEMASTFLQCKNYSYHAHCLEKAAALAVEEQQDVAARALMAALCATDAKKDQDPFATLAGGVVHQDVAALFDDPDVSRSALLLRLQLLHEDKNVLPADVLQLVKNVDAASRLTAVCNFDAAHAQLTSVLQSRPYLAPYEAPIRQVLLRHQLAHLAQKSNLVHITTLSTNGAPLTLHDYVHKLEPAILQDAAVPVEVDSKNGTLSFRNTTKAKLMRAFVHLARDVDLAREAKASASVDAAAAAAAGSLHAHTADGSAATEHADGHRAAKTAATASEATVAHAGVAGGTGTGREQHHDAGDGSGGGGGVSSGDEDVVGGAAYARRLALDLPTVAVSDLELVHKRAQLIHVLQLECLNSVDTRRKEREQEVERSKRERLQQRIREEDEKRVKAQQDQLARMQARYRERQRQERNKTVLAKLRSKYPHLRLDNALAERSNTTLEDELTHLLAAHKRRAMEGDQRDVLRGNLFQRALRQLDIPKRREYDAHNAEQRRAELADARKNFLAQHLQEYEKRQREKRVLQAFVDDAAQFEEQMRKRVMIDKASKRSEQQSLLEQEMQRLAAQAQE